MARAASPALHRCKCPAAKGLRLTDGPKYAACLPFKLVPLDGLTALYHRASGATHIIAEPMPEILAALGSDQLSIDALLAALAVRHDVATDVDAKTALAARMEELSALGIVQTL
jgi:PqqD family protein of HPr-rel-A system